MTGKRERDLEVFAEAVRLPDEERTPFLDRVCGGDEALRERMVALLKCNGRVGNFLEEPPTGAIAALRAGVPAGDLAGDWIDRYRLLHEIGEGGCGVVFLAEQQEPIRRRVALKLIKPGMDTKSVIARFEAERQALALMNHPNIAQVFDAGTTGSGRPYFVMELVEGVKISDYCVRHSLPLKARLELFVQVCGAIQDAHQKGIIHRDIKPSNILVMRGPAGEPVPKVIDFGIAKATTGQRLTDKTTFTADEILVGTPAYMSPEQAALASTEVDTRTDIYSLGVLLYELLTGVTPFDTHALLKVGFDEVRRVVREEEPLRPSTRLSLMAPAELAKVARHHGAEATKLSREMRGELDWIVMKALEKDRARRYATVHGLALDIGRYLAGEAVLARPASAGYRFRKLAARHKALCAGVTLIFLLLVISLITTTRWLMIERRANELVRVQAEIERLERSAYVILYQQRRTEAEELYRQALDLRQKGSGIDASAELSCALLLRIFNAQKRPDKIRPLLTRFVSTAQLSKGAFRDVFQSAIDTLARHGLWDDADFLAGELQKAIPENPTAYDLRAALLAAKGDTQGYGRLREEITGRFGGVVDPDLAALLAMDCLILPWSPTVSRPVTLLADRAVAEGPKRAGGDFPKICKALAEYRLEHYSEALNWTRGGTGNLGGSARACVAAVTAMVQYKLNQVEAARTAFADCNRVIEEKLPGLEKGELDQNWREWVIAHALQAEARRLLEGGFKNSILFREF